MSGTYFVYILRCEGDKLYTGVTTDVARRFGEHSRGVGERGAKFTAANRPLSVAAAWLCADRSAAQRLEYAVKHLTKAQKLALIDENRAAGLDLSAYMRMKTNEKGELYLTFICYPKCSTCKKAREWLTARGAEFQVRDIKEDNPTADELRALWTMSGLPLRRFFNTSGMLYREMGLASKLDDMTDEEKLALLASDGMLVKRPLLVGDGFCLVGFREKEWEERV